MKAAEHEDLSLQTDACAQRTIGIKSAFMRFAMTLLFAFAILFSHQSAFASESETTLPDDDFLLEAEMASPPPQEGIDPPKEGSPGAPLDPNTYQGAPPGESDGSTPKNDASEGTEEHTQKNASEIGGIFNDENSASTEEIEIPEFIRENSTENKDDSNESDADSTSSAERYTNDTNSYQGELAIKSDTDTSPEVYLQNTNSNMSVQGTTTLPAVTLKEGEYVKWVDRIDDTNNPSIKALYNTLVEGSDFDGEFDWLIEDKYYTNSQFTSTVFLENTPIGTIGHFGANPNVIFMKVATSPITSTPDAAVSEMFSYVLQVWTAWVRDSPHTFWLQRNPTWSRSSNSTEVSLYLKMMDPNENDCLRNTSEYENEAAIKKTYEALLNQANTIISAIPEGSSNYEKVEYITCWLGANNSYNSAAAAASSTYTSTDPWAATSALLSCLNDSASSSNKTYESPVCEGFAQAFKLLCDRMSIPCVTSTGYAMSNNTNRGGHAWNAVMIDGKWYYLDSTWDEDANGDPSQLGWFLIGSSIFFDESQLNGHHLENRIFSSSSNYEIVPLNNEPIGATTSYEKPKRTATILGTDTLFEAIYGSLLNSIASPFAGLQALVNEWQVAGNFSWKTPNMQFLEAGKTVDCIAVFQPQFNTSYFLTTEFILKVKVLAQELSPSDVTITMTDGLNPTAVSSFTYTGEAITPTFTIMFKESALVAGTDYTVSILDNTNIGTKEALIEFINNYTGNATISFDILAASIADALVAFEGDGTFVFGQQDAFTPRAVITVGNRTLVVTTDYTIVYSNNVNAGEAKVVLTGQGNYNGTLSKHFTIKPASLKGATVTVSDNLTYGERSTFTPTPTVMVGNKALLENTDYTVSYSNNTNAGTEATMTITGLGNYEGTEVGTFTINPAQIAESDVSLSQTTYTYNGTNREPTVSVVVGGTTLTEGTDYTVSYSNNRNAGIDATVTVIGQGNYTGTVVKKFTINAASITNASMEITGPYIYGEASATPTPLVTIDGTPLVKDTDYTVSYTKYETGGAYATITITGIGNYKGEKQKTYLVEKSPLENATIVIEGEFYADGTAQEPRPTITKNGKTLVFGTDYNLTYSNNRDKGTATVTATGMGNYTGTIAGTFTIAAANIANATVSLNDPSVAYTYSGSAYTPSILVTYNGQKLLPNYDYILSYENNTNAGTAYVVVTGKDNYGGVYKLPFKIAPAAFENPNIRILIAPTYDGTPQTPSFLIQVNGKILQQNVDYTITASNNVNAGNAAVYTLEGINNYRGTHSGTFTISPANIGSATVKVPGTFIYGTQDTFTPTPVVTWDGQVLLPSNYEITYSNNQNWGKASVLIEGKGNFTGTAIGQFEILRASIANATMDFGGPYSYGDLPDLKPTLTVQMNGKTLVADTDYRVSYITANAVGENIVTIYGQGNYNDQLTATYTIEALSIANATVNAGGPYTYSVGAIFEPTPTVTLNGNELTLNTDYYVTYSNNTGVGTAIVTVTGKGFYKDTVIGTFEIGAVSLADAIVTVGGPYEYRGTAFAPTPTVIFNGTTLTANTDYTVSYANNTNVGTASVIITGTGNYKDSAMGAFTINPYSLLDVSVTVSVPGTFTYGERPEFTPAPVVNANNMSLVNNSDFRVISYADNSNAGEATVILEGIGNYTGQISTTFRIERASIINAQVDITGDFVFVEGTTYTPEPIVTLGAITLLKGRDYEVTYTNNNQIGLATVRVTGVGNYRGSAIGHFTIASDQQIFITDAIVRFTQDKFFYEDGTPITPEITVSLPDGTILIKDTDYTVTYANNTQIGTATVNIFGINDYTGRASATFQIKERPELPFNVIDQTDIGMSAEAQLEGIPSHYSKDLIFSTLDHDHNNYNTLVSNFTNKETNAVLGMFNVLFKVNGTEMHNNFGRILLTFRIDDAWNGRDVVIHHLHANKAITTNTLKVQDGAVSLEVIDLSSFAIELVAQTTPEDPSDNNDPGTSTDPSGDNPTDPNTPSVDPEDPATPTTPDPIPTNPEDTTGSTSTQPDTNNTDPQAVAIGSALPQTSDNTYLWLLMLMLLTSTTTLLIVSKRS